MEENQNPYEPDMNTETTLEDVSKELKPGETLVLELSNNSTSQTDIIYDTLVMRGYNVKKSFRKGKNQIFVSKRI